MQTSSRCMASIATISSLTRGYRMRVNLYEYGRYLVSSEKAGEEQYLVDIYELDENGWCNCRDFECRHQPKVTREIERYGKVLSYSRCKHIQAALGTVAGRK